MYHVLKSASLMLGVLAVICLSLIAQPSYAGETYLFSKGWADIVDFPIYILMALTSRLLPIMYMLIVLLAMIEYFFYKKRYPDRAEERRNLLFLGVLRGGSFLTLIYIIFSPSDFLLSSVVICLLVAGFFYFGYKWIIKRPEKLRRPLVFLAAGFLFLLCLLGTYRQYISYKSWVTPAVVCRTKDNAEDFSTVYGNRPDRYSEIALILRIPVATDCRKKVSKTK